MVRPPSPWSRIGVALVGVVGLLGGCSSDSPSVGPSPSVDREAEALAHKRAEAEVRACFEAHGFAVVDDGEGSWGVEEPVSAAGQEDFQRAFDECVELFPETVPMSEEEVRIHFAALLDVASCLDELGYPQQAPPPSEDVFVSDYLRVQEGSGDDSLWHPYQAVPSQALADIEDVCPQP